MERKSIYVTQTGARIHRADGLVTVSVDRTIAGRWPPEGIEHVLINGRHVVDGGRYDAHAAAGKVLRS